MFVNDSNVFDRDGSDSEISWLGEPVTSNETKNYFKVNVISNGDESIFMIKDLKQFSYLQTEISQRYPDRNQEDLTVKFLGNFPDKNFNFVLIECEEDFQIFMRKCNDQNLYVSWVKENSTPINEPANSNDIPMDISFMALLLFILFLVIAIFFVGARKETAETVCESRVDHWSGHKKIIREFCEQYPSTEECQHIIVEFLSFMALDSLIGASV
ncbi:uncharacterized protein LOC119075353 isoform X1 [Bradysia coprophila]|uniref:uncharacterized protein LOC119075353 isoform X1 n=1 Tax=Bradysia coprophila TaxID=38358 RepID=UPI00187DD7C8|nr:uncharacterized protein LOC119075353 isoform X1 [Bradysia coprophila]